MKSKAKPDNGQQWQGNRQLERGKIKLPLHWQSIIRNEQPAKTTDKHRKAEPNLPDQMPAPLFDKIGRGDNRKPVAKWHKPAPCSHHPAAICRIGMLS